MKIRFCFVQKTDFSFIDDYQATVILKPLCPHHPLFPVTISLPGSPYSRSSCVAMTTDWYPLTQQKS